MFFHRRRRSCPLHLILMLLGVKAFACHKHADPEQREAMKSKGRLFRSKLKEAFAVWEADAEKEGAEAPAEQG
jgi:hypothetical protein